MVHMHRTPFEFRLQADSKLLCHIRLKCLESISHACLEAVMMKCISCKQL